jgi:glycosyltransferase involved in cell wall biosynthesis
MELCPHLADEVRAGCARNDGFVVLTDEHRDRLCQVLGVEPERVHVVGAGYREDLFHDRSVRPRSGLLYCGKYARAKGLPWLLDALERLPGVRLHVAGTGSGEEAESLGRRMRSMDGVTLHGQLDQASLADLMRSCVVMVLPSFYEGVPLVLVEAAASGLRIVATALPGIVENLAPHLGDALTLVDLPRMTGVDTPEPRDLPAFVDDLARALETTLGLPPLETTREMLEPFTWNAVFARIERVWLGVREPRA